MPGFSPTRTPHPCPTGEDGRWGADPHRVHLLTPALLHMRPVSPSGLKVRISKLRRFTPRPSSYFPDQHSRGWGPGASLVWLSILKRDWEVNLLPRLMDLHEKSIYICQLLDHHTSDNCLLTPCLRPRTRTCFQVVHESWTIIFENPEGCASKTCLGLLVKTTPHFQRRSWGCWDGVDLGCSPHHNPTYW